MFRLSAIAWLLLLTSGCSSGNQPGRSSSSGGAGNSSSGAGNCSDWRTQPDAGLCLSDSDCPSAYYCDYDLTLCGFSPPAVIWDGGPYLLATFDAGACRLGCPYNYQGACHVGEDCGQGICDGNPEPDGPTGDFCNLAQPCDAGQCTGAVGYPSPPPCPPSCLAMLPAHGTFYACVCPGNACVPPGSDGG